MSANNEPHLRRLVNSNFSADLKLPILIHYRIKRL